MARVLVVDDDANTIGVLCATLARAGHSVERASSGHEALKIIEKGGEIDLLLTDMSRMAPALARDVAVSLKINLPVPAGPSIASAKSWRG